MTKEEPKKGRVRAMHCARSHRYGNPTCGSGLGIRRGFVRFFLRTRPEEGFIWLRRVEFSSDFFVERLGGAFGQ